ncbi:MAG: methyltransferase domain-containing protein [Pseudomonadales bacterium]
MTPNKSSAESTAETYNDSDDADHFYETVWGGEDIHIGIYDEPGISIPDASHKTVEMMASSLEKITPDSKVIDLGAGYGGSARYLARRFGCHVTCLNVSERQNERNRMLNKKHGLQDKVSVQHGSFENIPEEDHTMDLVWSQDAFLHSGQRRKVLEEINRITRPGGELVFTDPMQADDCPPGVLQPVYDRLELDSLGSIRWYQEQLADLGFEEVKVTPMVEQLRNHYDNVGTELASRQNDLVGKISMDYLSRMLVGLKNWVDAADNGYLSWGILHFRKK